jgi:hypothetical protein
MSMVDQGSVAYGQLEPNDYQSEFNKVAFLVRQMIALLDTMKLVQVQAVHGGGGAIASAGTVDVLPLVSQLDGQGNVTQQNTAYGIPWWRLQGGNGAVVCDPQVNDIGYVIVSDRDITNVVATQAAAPPGSFRKYNFADGIYVGGCLNGPPTQYLSFTAQGLTLADLNGNKVAMAATGITITDANGNQIQMKAGIVNVVTGAFQVNGVPVTVP